MRILLLLMLLNLSVQAQDLQFSQYTYQYNTRELKGFTDTIFKQPPWIQPTVYIEFAPLQQHILGLTRKIGPNQYMVDLNPIFPRSMLERTLRHELIHVRQFHVGDLQQQPNGILWKGKLYPFNTPYETRPWEIEAHNLSRSGSSEESAHPHKNNKNNKDNNLNKDKLDKDNKDLIDIQASLISLLLVCLSIRFSRPPKN